MEEDLLDRFSGDGWVWRDLIALPRTGEWPVARLVIEFTKYAH